MPIKTSSGKWKWGNVERSSKKELVQTVYGIWKKNGSKGSFSDFLKGTHESTISEDTKRYAYHCTNVDPEIIKKEGWKVGDGFTLDNQFEDLYKKYLPNVPIFISRLDVPVWDSKAKYCIKLDITGLKLFPDFGYLPDFGAYYDYDEECFYWENEDDLDSNKKLKDFVLDNCDNLTLYADCFDGDDSFNILGTACVDGSKLKDRIVEWKSNIKESLVKEYWAKNGKYFYCHDCDKNMSKAPDDQYIMIDDDLWEYVCKHGGKKIGTEEDLCRDCIEKRLGRPLTLKDLGDKANLPINDAFKNMLKYGNRDIVSELCKAVAKHKVRDEDGDIVSVAFGGNCGIFAYALLMFLNDIDYNFYEWSFGFLFQGIKSLSQIYKDDNNADLNHVVAIIDNVAYDGSGKTNLNEWNGKLFQIDDGERAADIIDQFTVSSIGVNALYKIFEKEWKKLTGKKRKVKESVLSEDKTSMIKKLVLPDIEDQKEKDEYKQELLAFFKSHSNFENKIDWNKYKTLTKKDFDPIISSAENTKGAEKRREKAEISSDIKNIFKSQKGRLFSIVGENDQWLFVAPLNYEAAKFCDSSENQGAGAQWCIGYEKTDEYWYNYMHDGSVFVMAFNKDYKNLSARDIKKKLKFMIQRDDEHVYHVWNQPDKDITNDLSMFGDEKQIADDMFDKAAAKLLEEKERLRKSADTDIPKILNGVKVIEKKTLNKYMDLVTKIDIPDNVTEIGDEAFCMFSELTSITIPNSVTVIGRSAFSDCHNLVSVNIPNSVTIIGSGAFQYCSKIESIAIPDNVIKIGSNAFSYCSGLTGNLEIPDSVESIGDAAFRGCENLTSIKLPANIKNIGDVTFCRCFNLESINIPNGVERIGIWAFSNCENLKSITIPDSVTSMGMDSFGGCKNLKTIYCSEQTWNRFREKLLRDLKDVTRKDPTEMKKESIDEAAMIHSYPEKLQPIIDRIVKGNEDYELDHAYFNKEGKFIWMRNSKGYFHIFKPVKLKNVKWKPFAFRDLILQDDGMMKPLDLIQFNDGHEGLRYLQTNYHFNANTMI